MAHPNDTLQGKLLEWEREDQKHLRSRFGYWRMVEERMVRYELEREGHDPNEFGFIFKVSKRITENHRNDPTLREQQAAARAAQGPVTPSEHASFTREELERLIEHFGMANDPVTLSIHSKAWAALVRMEMRGE